MAVDVVLIGIARARNVVSGGVRGVQYITPMENVEARTFVVYKTFYLASNWRLRVNGGYNHGEKWLWADTKIVQDKIGSQRSHGGRVKGINIFEYQQ